MAMESIQGSPLLRQNAVDSFRKTRDPEVTGRSSDSQRTTGTESSKPQAAGDEAIISPAGKQLVDLRQAVDTGRAALAALPEVREDKLAAAKDRLERGFYQSATVRDKVASRLAGMMLGMDSMTP